MKRFGRSKREEGRKEERERKGEAAWRYKLTVYGCAREQVEGGERGKLEARDKRGARARVSARERERERGRCREANAC